MLPRDAMTILAVMKKSIAAADGRIENLEEKINQILPGYDYKGSVATKTALPDDATVGDLYTVTDENNAQYAWDGENWIMPLFPTITTAQINALF